MTADMNPSRYYPVVRHFGSSWTPAACIIAVTFAEVIRTGEREEPIMNAADLRALADTAALVFFESPTRSLLAAEADAWASFENQS
jgi:hypothetical protein